MVASCENFAMQEVFAAGDGENWDLNRPADVCLPSPDRVDKVPKQWSIPADACQGSAGRVRKGSRLGAAPLADAAQEGLSSLGLAEASGAIGKGRRSLGQKRKGVA